MISKDFIVQLPNGEIYYAKNLKKCNNNIFYIIIILYSIYGILSYIFIIIILFTKLLFL
jgi:hypothetical protein